MRSGKPALESSSRLHGQLINCYQFNVIAGLEALDWRNKNAPDGSSYVWAGYLKSSLGKIDEAEKHYADAEDLFRREKDNLGLANTLLCRGKLESKLRKIDEAEKHCTDAEDLFRLENDNLGLANTLKSRGNLECMRGKIAKAEKHYTDAEDLYRREKNNLGLADTLRSMGLLERERGHLDDALIHYTRAANLYRDEQAPMGLAYTLTEIIRCRYAQKTLPQNELDALTKEAWLAALASGIESVEEYVLCGLGEACDKDQEKFEALLKRIGAIPMNQKC